MRLLLVFVLSLFVTLTYADTKISIQIHDIDLGQSHEDPLIYLSNGQVVILTHNNKHLFESLQNAVKSPVWFSITLNNQREIIAMEEIAVPPIFLQAPALNLKSKLNIENPYRPSILKDLDQARLFFYDARVTAKEDSQCFDRAHVWTFEWRKKHLLYSSKAWLFFTRKFIRKHKFEWWFHVAPLVHVVIDNEVKQRVMDVKYAKGPLKLKQWTDIFMRDNADCPVVQKYSDHANYPESGSCFLMTSSMYYYQPVDLEMQEQEAWTKTRWIESEVRKAFLSAYDVTL